MESNYEIVTQKDLNFKPPFSMMVCGPSQSGKTEFVRTLLEKKIFNEEFDRVLWLYGEYQTRYQDPIPGVIVEYIDGFDLDAIKSCEKNKHTLIVLDDMMEELGSNKEASKLFTRGVHHKNLSVVFIVQNIFFQGSQMRNISLNNQYFILMRSDRIVSQVYTLGCQILPQSPKSMVKMYEKATDIPFGHLLIDLHPRTKKSLKFRSNIFSDFPIIHKVKQ